MANYCTKEHPMPREQDRDQMGQHWIHVDAVEKGPFFNLRLYECPNCGITFHALPRS